MSEIYVVDYGATHITSNEEFALLLQAEEWQAALLAHDPTVGTLLTFAQWELTPGGILFQLDDAKTSKIDELIGETTLRTSVSITSIATLQAVVSIFDPSVPSTAEGLSNEAILSAFLLAEVDVLALPNIAAVNAYNVVTDPAWPVSPILTTNLANIQVLQESAATTTTLVNGVWTALNCSLTQNGSDNNFDVAGNVLTYTGETVQELLATYAISGASAMSDAQSYRIGYSVNGGLPIMSFKFNSSHFDGLCNATGIFVLPDFAQGDTVTPYIMNTGSDTDFNLDDVIVTIGRWTT